MPAGWLRSPAERESFTRVPAGGGSWWSIVTLIAVFPANVHMALHPDRYRRIPGGRPSLIARLPLQALMIAWAWAAGT